MQRAKTARDEHMKQCTEWAQFLKMLNEKGLPLSPFCGDKACEDQIKEESGKYAL